MKLELHEHISRLLYEHECVVVPGFGAFLTRFYPSEINQATHMMRPPSRRVYFNKSIKENDGLLTKSISLTERKPYDMSLRFIKEEVQRWKQVLVSGKKLHLSGIGRVYLDDHENLQFSPSLENNYLTSSYGLSIFRSPAIQREQAIRKNIHQAIERHIVAEKPTQQQEETKGRKSRRIPWAAVLGPVIFAGIVGAGAYYAYEENQFENLSGINWFRFSRTTEKVEEPKEATSEATATEAEAEEAPTYETSATDFSTESVEKTDPAPMNDADYSTSSATARTAGYHIVVGSFKDQENADTYIAELEAQGYEPYLAGGDANFQRVAIGAFSNRSAALNALTGIRSNINAGAWVYSN